MAASPGGAGPTDGSGRELTEGSGGRPGDGLTDDSGPRPGPIDHGSTQGPQDAPQGGPGQAGHPGHSGSGRHRRPTSLGPLRRGIREVGLALITAGVIILLFVGYQLWGTGIAEAHSQAALKRDFNATVTATHGGSGGTDTPTVGGATPTAASTVTASGAVDHLVIPKIHLDVFVVEGVSEDDLRRGPGHYPQTVFPGQNGNAAIAGHRTTYGAPFFSLDGLSVGDEISVTNTTGQTFIYKVSVPPRVVSPNDVAVLDPTPYAELTLTTCNPRYSASSRLIIVARLARVRRCRRTRGAGVRNPFRRGNATSEPPRWWRPTSSAAATTAPGRRPCVRRVGSACSGSGCGSWSTGPGAGCAPAFWWAGSPYAWCHCGSCSRTRSASFPKTSESHGPAGLGELGPKTRRHSLEETRPT